MFSWMSGGSVAIALKGVYAFPLLYTGVSCHDTEGCGGATKGADAAEGVEGGEGAGGGAASISMTSPAGSKDARVGEVIFVTRVGYSMMSNCTRKMHTARDCNSLFFLRPEARSFVLTVLCDSENRYSGSWKRDTAKESPQDVICEEIILMFFFFFDQEKKRFDDLEMFSSQLCQVSNRHVCRHFVSPSVLSVRPIGCVAAFLR
jgi:hypothetical protein